jgi:hypothetical protein
VLVAEYQEQTWMLCDLPWFDWRGCYVIFHVKPLSLAAFEPMITVLAMSSHVIVYYDDLVSSELLCWDD